MKIILAPDSFKGSLTAVEVADILAQAAGEVFGSVDIIKAPIADGGEGTVEAMLAACGGEWREVSVTGPQGQPVCARYGLLAGGGTAVLEMAQASGLPLVPPDAPDPLHATSRGTGEMLLHALDSGARHILFGIGGSATNDGGMGFLRALGASFLDVNGGDVPEGAIGLEKVASISLADIDPRVTAAEITILSDVTNPLTGPSGATYIYGPQKGLSGADLDRAEAGMLRYAAVLEKETGKALAACEGAGAAGGMGAALLLIGAKMRRGVDAVLDAIGLDALLEKADLVVTGEGRMDGQSVRYGKGPAGIGARAKRQGVPVLAVAGGMTAEAMPFCREGEASIMTSVNAPMTVREAIEDARALLAQAAERMFRMVRVGMALKK